MPNSLFLRVPKKEGEKYRRELSDEGVLRKDAKITSDLSFIYLPISRKFKTNLKILKRLSIPLSKKPRSIEDALKGKLSQSQLASLTKSFDIIGDIAILEIPASLQKHELKIAKAVSAVHPNVKCVCKKTSGMQGKFRIRKVKVLLGRRSTSTLYTENGMRMLVDISKMYFSPRLSTERKRIAEMVREKENVLVLFSGCCPYPLIISKFQPDCKITAIELNPKAHESALKNIALNKAGNITAILGDARKVVKRSHNRYNRICMPLPKGAEKFLAAAFCAAKPNCTVHIYSFGPRENPCGKVLEAIEKQAEKSKRKIQILNKKMVRPFAPGIEQWVIDFKIF